MSDPLYRMALPVSAKQSEPIVERLFTLLILGR